MADRRTKRQKLEEMAKQTVSPHEAEVAKRKLETLEEKEEPVLDAYYEYLKRRSNIETFEATIIFDFTPMSSGQMNQGFFHPAGFGNPVFDETNGEGTFVYDFVKEEWRRVK